MRGVRFGSGRTRLLIFGVLAVLSFASPAAAAEPSVSVEQPSAKLGDTVSVRLSGWPAGVVTAAFCGDEGRWPR
jgi:hypothetical protein